MLAEVRDMWAFVRLVSSTGTRQAFSVFMAIVLLVVLSATPAVGKSPSQAGDHPTSAATQLVTTPAQLEAMRIRLLSLREGETTVLGVVEGFRVAATRSDGEISIVAIPLVSGTGGDARSDFTAATGPTFCSYAVASFLWGLGAAFLGLAALLGITIVGPFGIVITPYMAGLLAGFMGSYSLLLAAVSFYVC